MEAIIFNVAELWENLPPAGEIDQTLREWGIFDESLTQEHRYERYVRFEGVSFGVAPLEEWPRLRQSLL